MMSDIVEIEFLERVQASIGQLQRQVFGERIGNRDAEDARRASPRECRSASPRTRWPRRPLTPSVSSASRYSAGSGFTALTSSLVQIASNWSSSPNFRRLRVTHFWVELDAIASFSPRRFADETHAAMPGSIGCVVHELAAIARCRPSRDPRDRTTVRIALRGTRADRSRRSYRYTRNTSRKGANSRAWHTPRTTPETPESRCRRSSHRNRISVPQRV